MYILKLMSNKKKMIYLLNTFKMAEKEVVDCITNLK